MSVSGADIIIASQVATFDLFGLGCYRLSTGQTVCAFIAWL